MFSPNAGFSSTDLVGFIALATLVGIFEKEATSKLQQIATALLTASSVRTDRVSASAAAAADAERTPRIESATPSTLHVGTTNPQVTLTCRDVRDGATVVVRTAADKMPVERTASWSGDALVVQLTTAEVSSPGMLRLSVRNAGGRSESPPIQVVVAA